MEILALKLFVTEGEVNGLIQKFLPEPGAVDNLRVRLTPEGIVVQGDYPTLLVKMAFETLWEVAVDGGEVRARLASVKVAGLPAGMLRGVLLKVLRDVTDGEAGLEIRDETVHVDVDRVLRARGLPVRVHLTAVRCSIGTLVLEAGPSPGG
jgi:hypothetical protein